MYVPLEPWGKSGIEARNEFRRKAEKPLKFANECSCWDFFFLVCSFVLFCFGLERNRRQWLTENPVMPSFNRQGQEVEWSWDRKWHREWGTGHDISQIKPQRVPAPAPPRKPSRVTRADRGEAGWDGAATEGVTNSRLRCLPYPVTAC